MEKAYAKLYGSYSKIEAGLTGDAIRELTGAPYDYLYQQVIAIVLNLIILTYRMLKKLGSLF
jgi:hypothetical protein